MNRLYSRVSRLVLREQANRPDASVLEIVGNALRSGTRYLLDRLWAVAYLHPCDAVGTGARCVGRPRIVNQGSIRIGDHFNILNGWIPTEIVAGPDALIDIGSHVTINYGCSIFSARRVFIGDRVMIGNLSIIADTRYASAAKDEQLIHDEAEPIEIGDGVWLASRVTILPGTKIGAGTVITAGSIVSGEIPAGVIAGGNPARVLRAISDNSEARAPNVRAVQPPGIGAMPLPVEPRFRGTLIADFTADELANYLRDCRDFPRIDVEVAPFGQVLQSLIQGPSRNYEDFALIWTRPDSAVPLFGRLLGCEIVSEDQLLIEVDSFCSAIATGSTRYRYLFVASWVLPPWQRGLGMLDMRTHGASHALTAMNLRLMNKLSTIPNVYVMNAQRWMDLAGRNAHSIKGWYLGKLAFNGSVFQQAILDIKAAIRGLSGHARKLLILDLDDVLWGGVVGDLGWENIRLGGHDSIGEAYVDFQKRLKALTRRGVILGIVSKNTESIALEAIDNHPEMVLRKSDFVGWRINWNDKARNVAGLAAELNIGLQSVVFIDDNPAERARVREALPEVLVPEWPEDVLLYPSAIDSLSCFDTPAISDEDLTRTSLYVQERERRESVVGDLDDWLKGLGIRVKIEPLLDVNRQRAAQLLNKTNQMNLSTRRLTEQELQAWTMGANRKFLTLTLSDRFGDAGLTGLLSIEFDDNRAQIVDFVLSCRVMGRKIERIMTHLAVEYARNHGAKRVEACYIRTPKNKPCYDFWIGSGFSESGDRFVWECSAPYDPPSFITVEGG
jgi:FkbH-like protein